MFSSNAVVDCRWVPMDLCFWVWSLCSIRALSDWIRGFFFVVLVVFQSVSHFFKDLLQMVCRDMTMTLNVVPRLARSGGSLNVGLKSLKNCVSSLVSVASFLCLASPCSSGFASPKTSPEIVGSTDTCKRTGTCDEAHLTLVNPPGLRPRKSQHKIYGPPSPL